MREDNYLYGCKNADCVPSQIEHHPEPEDPAEPSLGHDSKSVWRYRYEIAMWKLLGPILVSRMISKARKKIAILKSIDDALDFAWSFSYVVRSICPAQVRSEFATLLAKASETKPKYVLEIGTANGGTLFLFTRIASPDAMIISVDLPGGKFGGGYPESLAPLFKSFGKEGQTIQLLRADSHDAGTLSKVKDMLAGNALDLLFIDGDHSYEGVKRDFEMYSPLVKKGGIVAIHDIAKHPANVGCEVDRFWKEVKDVHPYTEVLADPKATWAGIGILQM